MDNNQFLEKQLIFLYNDPDFLNFISNYFSSYDVSEVSNNVVASSNIQEIDWKIFLRILLANIETVSEALAKIEKNISFSYDEKRIISSGGIKGKLLVDEYVKNKTMVRLPKEYPCLIKEKSFNTPENEYIMFIVKALSEKLFELLENLEKLTKGNETEIQLLRETLDYYEALSRRYPFNNITCVDIRTRAFPPEKINSVYTRLAKGKIRNAYAYQSLFEWYEKFLQHGFAWLNTETVNMIIYDEQFTNKLFEIWCLYKIIQKFKTDFGMTIIDENALCPGLENYVCKLLTIDGAFVEVYYQKGKGLYWDDQYKQNWHYIRSKRNGDLIGIPDISIKYIGETENITLIDLKNRVRSGGDNSEEIYKVIGYFSNFSAYLKDKYDSEFKNQAVLIFRNDIDSFVEELESDSGESILVVSVAAEKSIDLCENQFKEICRYVLDMQGIEGTKSQTLSNCSKNMEGQYADLNDAINNHDDEKADDIMYQLQNTNHEIVSSMFKTDVLSELLESKKEELQKNHFPHIWEEMCSDTKDTLAMADSLFSGLSDCEGADYAPVCLEFCRALEIQLNDLIFTPFRNYNNIASLAMLNWNYKKLDSDRELTLGECIYILRKCITYSHPTAELKRYIQANIKRSQELFDYGLDCLEQINVDVRRKAAHTTLMSYTELVESRQRVMGIGNINLFYILLDRR